MSQQRHEQSPRQGINDSHRNLRQEREREITPIVSETMSPRQCLDPTRSPARGTGSVDIGPAPGVRGGLWGAPGIPSGLQYLPPHPPTPGSDIIATVACVYSGAPVHCIQFVQSSFRAAPPRWLSSVCSLPWLCLLFLLTPFTLTPPCP